MIVSSWLYWTLVLIVVISGLYDFNKRIIPNFLTIPLFLTGIAYQLLNGNFMAALAGFGFAFFVAFFAWLSGGLGGGDLKLMAGLGIWLGLESLLVVLLVGSIIGIVWGMIKLAKQNKLKKRMSFFLKGLYLFRVTGLRGVIIPLPEETKVSEYRQKTVPYGTCLAIGMLFLPFIKIF